MTLRKKAEDLFDKCKGFVNLCVKQTFDGLDDFGRLDENQLNMLKSANELMEQSGEYFVKQAYMQDEMADKLDSLQKDMKEVNRKLNVLLAKQERKEVKES